MTNILRIASLLTILLLLVQTPLVSTICIGPSSKGRAKDADAIFIGKAIKWVETTTDVGKDGYAVQFQVEKAWRGVSSPTIIINSPNPVVCGFLFVPGSTYLLYAKHHVTGLAWGCKELPNPTALEEIRLLGDPIYEIHERN